jgi:hypothetical protein
MKCYLAHPITEYGTARQLSAIKTIESFGWTVENPDQPHHDAAYKEQGMAYFTRLVDECDALAFLRFSPGEIGAGVGKEIAAALARDWPVFEIIGGTLAPVDALPEILSVEATRAMIAEWRAR